MRRTFYSRCCCSVSCCSAASSASGAKRRLARAVLHAGGGRARRVAAGGAGDDFRQRAGLHRQQPAGRCREGSQSVFLKGGNGMFTPIRFCFCRRTASATTADGSLRTRLIMSGWCSSRWTRCPRLSRPLCPPPTSGLSPDRLLSARVYRDLRYVRDGLLYREDMWLSFKRDKKRFPNCPSFIFTSRRPRCRGAAAFTTRQAGRWRRCAG